MNEGIVREPRLKDAAIITVVGYLMSWGVPYASFAALPKLLSAQSAAATSQNILAHRGQFVFVIFAFLINFIGDVVAAWGLYLLLRPVSASFSMFVAWLRVVFAALGIAAVQNLVTAYRLLTRASSLSTLGQETIDAQVQVAVSAFNAQFAFSLIVFGVYLILLGWLAFRSGYVPKWLSAVLVIDGAGWVIMESGPYLWPGADLGFLFVATFGELFLLVWLIGWGTRLSGPSTS
jgi:hypothetical protein